MSRNLELIRQLNEDANRADIAKPAGEIKLCSLNDAGALYGEEIVMLVQAVFLSPVSRSAQATQAVVFCGVDESEGSSAVCASTATALSAVTGKSVCMVDGNLRSTFLSGLFKFEKKSDSAEPATSLYERCSRVNDKLWVAGTDVLTDPYGALLPAPELKQCFTLLKSTFDFVLVDAPGVGVSKDAALIGEVAGSAILVIEANATRRQAAKRAKQSLEAAGVRFLGTVLRNRTFPIPEGILKHL